MRKIIAGLLLAFGITAAAAQAPPPVPALPDTARLTTYSITATTCACAVGFQLYADSTDVANWIQVWVNGVQMAQAGNWTLSSPTGSLATIPRPITDAVLTFTTAQTGTIQIVGARRPRRLSQFSENRGVAARDLNQAVTTDVSDNREQWDATLRTIIAPPGDPAIPLLLPSSTTRATKLLGFDANGAPAVFTPGVGGGGNVVGPAGATNNDLACFNGTTGLVIKDCATGLPLALTQGGSGQTSAAAARGSAGYNIDEYTPRGDAIYTILSTDRTIGTSAAFTAPRIWTLPAANSVNPGQLITVADYFGGITSSNTLTVQRAGADTINGATSTIINSAFGRVDLRSDGVSKWSISTVASGTLGSQFKAPSDYGALCDGATDDTVAIQAWLDGIKTNAFTGWVPAGKICIYTGLLSLSSGTTIYAYGATFKQKNSAAGSNNSGLVWGPTSQLGSGVTGTAVFGLTMDGNRANNTNTAGSGAMFYVVSAINAILRDVTAQNGRGDGIYVGGDSSTNGVSKFITLDNVNATGNRRNGTSIVGLDRGLILGGLFNNNNNTTNDGPQCGIDFEPNGATTQNTFITAIGISASANGGTLSTTGGSGICVFNVAANTTHLVIYGPQATSNQRYGVDAAASMVGTTLRVLAVAGAGNGTALVNTANVIDWLPPTVQKGAANGCGAGFSCVGIPN